MSLFQLEMIPNFGLFSVVFYGLALSLNQNNEVKIAKTLDRGEENGRIG